MDRERVDEGEYRGPVGAGRIPNRNNIRMRKDPLTAEEETLPLGILGRVKRRGCLMRPATRSLVSSV